MEILPLAGQDGGGRMGGDPGYIDLAIHGPQLPCDRQIFADMSQADGAAYVEDSFSYRLFNFILARAV